MSIDNETNELTEEQLVFNEQLDMVKNQIDNLVSQFGDVEDKLNNCVYQVEDDTLFLSLPSCNTDIQSLSLDFKKNSLSAKSAIELKKY